MMVDINKIKKNIQDRAEEATFRVQDAQRRFNDRMQDRRDRKLLQAVTSGRIDAARDIIAKGANVNAKFERWHNAKDNYIQQTILEIAAENYHFNIVEMLLEAGADPNVEMKSGSSFLTYVAGGLTYSGDPNKERCYELALEKGADIGAVHNEEENYRPTVLFALAQTRNYKNLLKDALNAGVDTEVLNKDKKRADQYSEYKLQDGNRYIIRLFREAPMISEIPEDLCKADLELRNEAGYCALDHWETWARYDEVKDALAENGERLTLRDLLEPVEGISDDGEPLTRLAILMECDVALGNAIYDFSMWRGEEVDFIQEFMNELPEEYHEDAPLHAITAAIRRHNSQGVGQDGGGRMR